MINPKVKRPAGKPRKRSLLAGCAIEAPSTKTYPSKRALNNRFVLVYKGVEDPDASTVRNIANALKPAKVVEVLPGTLKVEGSGIRIKRMAGQFESWTLSPEGQLCDRSPVVTRFAPHR